MKGSKPLLLSCFLAFALVHSTWATHDARAIIPVDSSSTPETASATASASTTTTSSSSTTTTSTSSTTTTSSSSSTTTTSNTSTTSKTTSTTSSTSATPTAVVTTTNAAGSTVFVTATEPLSNTSSSPSSTATSGSDTSNNNNTSSGLGIGSIIGLSVAGGVALLGIIAFFIWKFTRKRFSDFDDSEGIKWPELNAHSDNGGDSHPLPVHNTGRAGFDTGSEISLSRAPSTTAHPDYSTPDLGNDPYAIPPLPHLNPNQPGPYRDDPAAVGAYYDPYRGPVPGTFSEPNTATEWGPQGGHPGEAYPMAQMGALNASGRASPGPTMMGRASPNPGGYPAGYPMTGRGSPGPRAAYDNYSR